MAFKALKAFSLDAINQELKRIWRAIRSSNHSYKSYSALLTQSGTNDPTVKILKNEIGDIVWTYWGPQEGFVKGTLTGAFPADKTVVIVANNREGITRASERNDDNTVYIFSHRGKVTVSSLGEETIVLPKGVNGGLIDTFVEVRVYY